MERPVGHLIQLSDAEIRATVEGHYIDIDRGPDGIAPFQIQRERYCRGTYTTRGDRVPTVERPYTINEGRLCVDDGDSASCRTLHRDESGRLHMRWVHEQGPDTWMEIEIGPLSDCPN